MIMTLSRFHVFSGLFLFVCLFLQNHLKIHCGYESLIWRKVCRELCQTWGMAPQCQCLSNCLCPIGIVNSQEVSVITAFLIWLVLFCVLFMRSLPFPRSWFFYITPQKFSCFTFHTYVYMIHFGRILKRALWQYHLCACSHFKLTVEWFFSKSTESCNHLIIQF